MRSNKTDLDGVTWRKSSFSQQPNGDCVEVAILSSGEITVRDSKNPTAAAVILADAEWRAFTAGIRRGDFS